MKNILRLLRPKQWTKNVFVMLPLFFGGQLLNLYALCQGLIVMLAFSFAASSIYCLNDIADLEADRRHPVKCNRPIASGAVSKTQAWMLMGGMLLLAIVTLLAGSSLPSGNPPSALTSHLSPLYIVLGYWLMNVAYCLWLKHIAIVDVCIVASGFVLRMLAGGMATGIVLSKWIVLMGFLLTLFLSLAKRRDDVLRMMATGEAPRRNTSRYNMTFINEAITITATVTLVCYVMYTVSPEVIRQFHTDYLYLTTVFVLLGLLRYLQKALVDQQTGDPTRVLLTDRFTQLVVAAWVVSFLVLIYL
ncbi:MAG: decaprenyl-phosphate phosphoribosyltransferase [Prevotella sp.]|nr:decaprenyl-phosphate phosphoribosyltransferase [Prevotella sp.]